MAHAPETIERIRAGTDIVALVGRQVALKRSGRNHMGRCPFHQERTPSFSVNADKGMFYCFGCHQGGDVFAWVMQALGMDFGAAVRHLADAAGIILDDQTPAQKAQLARQSRLRAALVALQAQLTTHLWAPAGAHARKYLGTRKVPAAQARAWALGLAHDGRVLAKTLLDQGFSPQELLDAGILTEDAHAPRILLHGRLTFPIHDMQGQLVGFGGRRLSQDGPQGPKYLGSRDSELFHKRGQLFGLHKAHSAIRHTKQMVLVEGFMDVLAAHQAGLQHTVAALGTALTKDHAALAKRLADEVVVMLDGDAAGERAAYAATQTLLTAGLRVKVAWLPPGEDPASLVHTLGVNALKDVLAGAQGAVEALMAKAFATPAQSITDRVHIAQTLMPLFDAMQEGLEHALYLGRLADHVGVDVATLRSHWVQAKSPSKKDRDKTSARAAAGQPPRPTGQKSVGASGPPASRQDGAQGQDGPPLHNVDPPKSDPHALRELEMVRELLLYPELKGRFEELSEYLLSQQIRELLEKLAHVAGDSAAMAHLFLAHVKDSAWRQRLARIVPLTAETLDAEPSRANRTFDDILRRLKWRHVDAALSDVLRELRAAEQQGDATDLLLRRKQELTARKRALAKASR